MSDGFALAFQKGVRAALVANPGVTNLVSTRVYDEPPQNVTFPYLRFVEVDPEAFDTDGTLGATIDLTLQAHSRSASGRVEATQITEAVYGALHRQEASVTATGFNVIEVRFVDSFAERGSDGRGYDAFITFEILIEAA